jgi:GNAT superfamily N-acetyltransferase
MTGATQIRRVHPEDDVALRNFYSRLSPHSRHSRFLGGVSGLSTGQSMTFCTPDHMHAEGFVAISERPSDHGTILGHLCLEPAGRRRLELALAVADAEQGHGIGRALFGTALAWAMEHSYRSIVASCLVSNGPVLSLLSSAPYGDVITTTDAGVVNVTIPLLAPLPEDWTSPPAHGPRHRRAKARVSLPCHAVWRRGRPPAHVAEG